MARQRLAIVGPADSVNLINSVAQEKEEMLFPLPIAYRDASEVPMILQTRSQEADIWLFSGIVPYRYALTVPRWTKPLLYIPHTGSSLYRAFVQITQSRTMPLDNISFDTFNRWEIEEIFRDLEMSLPTFHIKQYSGIISAEELTGFHRLLWEKGKTQVAITCFSKTYEELKALNIPAFRISPTRDSIRAALDTAMRMAEARRFLESQIAVGHVAIDNYEKLVRDAGSSYDVNRTEIRLYEVLVDFAQQIGGSVIPQGGGNYIIFTTRGQIAEITQDFTMLPFLNTINQKLTVHLTGGIGFGVTAYQAEENARMAQGLARRQGPGRWMIVTDDRTAIGPINATAPLRSLSGANGRKLKALAKRLQVSPMTLDRLIAFAAQLGAGAAGNSEIAAWLEVTPRSTRRIMSALREEGLIYLCGEEATGRGRPRKTYRFVSDKLVE